MLDPYPPNRYYIFDFDLTLRAAQHKRENATRYLTPDRVLLGPLTPAQCQELITYARTHPDSLAFFATLTDDPVALELIVALCEHANHP